MTTDELQSALFSVHDRLTETDISWAVTASANLWLQGFDLTPADLDILTDAEGVYRIESIFESHVERPVQPPEIAGKERIRSHFGSLSLHGVEVELMGGVEHRRNGEWTPIEDVGDHQEFVEQGNREIPVMNLEHELRGYRDLGRPERVELLEAHFQGGDER